MAVLAMLSFILLTLIPTVAANFGGCCGMSYVPPPCPPAPICAPPPLPCPPPPICPPQFCPPPPLCPPPPPPPPPPMCPPPMPVFSPCQTYQPAPQYVAPAANDCCCRCGIPCHYRRHRTHGSKIFSAVTEIEDEDPTCNSSKLKIILEDNMTHDPTIAKRAIQKAAEEKLFGKWNVICAKGDFSYVAYTETYCQASNDDITCYAFKPM